MLSPSKAVVALTLGLMCSLSYAKTVPETSTICAPKQYLMSLKYQQQSAEIQALQLQSFQLATYRLKDILAAHPQAKNLAIVTDLDETVLDNSDLFVENVEKCLDYTQWDAWGDWERRGQPKLIPGSLAFLNFANQQGVKIYYVSDRSEKHRDSTTETLKKLALPQVNAEQILLYGQTKEERRQLVEKDHKIVLLLGDTLHDFSKDFNNQQNKLERQNAVSKNQTRFGQDWIVLPNVSYGAWSKDDFSPVKSFPVDAQK